jgi:ABC-type branched-subunit amino acid transport system ATPase component/ABC-type branched-subunit amino acid transport system permease subunit
VIQAALERIHDFGERRFLGIVGVAGLAVLLVWTMTSGDYESFQLARFCIFTLLFLSLVVITGQAGVISLLTAAYFGVGAFATATAVSRYDLPFLLGLLVSGLVTAAACVIVGLPVLRLPPAAFIVMTLGFVALIEEVVFTNEWCCGGGAVSVPAPRPSFAETDPSYLLLCAAVLVGAYAFTVSWRTSRVGRALVASRDNPRAAEVLGINVVKARLVAFAVSGFIAGLAGGLFAGLLGGVSSLSGVFGIDRGIEFFGLTMLGGVTSMVGPVIAAGFRVLLQLTPVGEWEHFGLLLLTVAGPGTVLVYLRAPEGIAGMIRSWKERRLARGVRADHREDPGPDDGVVASRPAALSDWPGGAALECRAITCRFGGITALDEVDLAVAPGEVVGLLGTNGAGKSTLINVISGVVPTVGGRVLLDGEDLLDRLPHERAGLGVSRSFQHAQLFPRSTVIENLLVAEHPAMRHGLFAGGLRLPRSRREESAARDHVEAVLDVVDLTPFADARADELSYGTLRLVQLAAMLTQRPRLLLLDEPAAGLAEAEARALSPLLKKISAHTGVSIVLVEHDVELVAAVSDRIVGMDSGRVLVSGTPAEVLADPKMVVAYLGLDDPTATADEAVPEEEAVPS